MQYEMKYLRNLLIANETIMTEKYYSLKKSNAMFTAIKEESY